MSDPRTLPTGRMSRPRIRRPVSRRIPLAFDGLGNLLCRDPLQWHALPAEYQARVIDHGRSEKQRARAHWRHHAAHCSALERLSRNATTPSVVEVA
jgi:hypothetical protein